jgi:hypothetical protein
MARGCFRANRQCCDRISLVFGHAKMLFEPAMASQARLLPSMVGGLLFSKILTAEYLSRECSTTIVLTDRIRPLDDEL